MSDFTASARVRVTVEVLNLGPRTGADWKPGTSTIRWHARHSRGAAPVWDVLQVGKERAHGQFRVVGRRRLRLRRQGKVKP